MQGNKQNGGGSGAQS